MEKDYHYHVITAAGAACCDSSALYSSTVNVPDTRIQPLVEMHAKPQRLFMQTMDVEEILAIVAGKIHIDNGQGFIPNAK